VIVLSRFGNKRGNGIALIFVVIGAILGGLLGEILQSVEAVQGVIPYLVQTYPVLDTGTVTLDLYVIHLTAGISFTPNLMSIFGIVIAILLFRHY
jgi:hypothetical protein